MGREENKVETYLQEKIEEAGGITRKWVSPNHVGVPDQLVIIPVTVREMMARLMKMDPTELVADITAVEVKTLGNVPEDHQMREMRRLRDAGMNVTWVAGRRGVDIYMSKVK